MEGAIERQELPIQRGDEESAIEKNGMLREEGAVERKWRLRERKERQRNERQEEGTTERKGRLTESPRPREYE